MRTASMSRDPSGAPYQGGTPTPISTNTTTTVSNVPTIVHAIVVNNPGSSWVITCYDNTTATGTPFAVLTSPVNGGNYVYDCECKTGLTIVTSGTTAGHITVVTS